MAAGAGNRISNSPRPNSSSRVVPGLGILVLLLAGILGGCGQAARVGQPALPPGFQERGVLDVDSNVAAYLSTGQLVSLPIAALGGGDGLDLHIASIETLANEPTTEYAARVEFAENSEAKLVSGALSVASAGDDLFWIEGDGRFVNLGRSDAGWGDTVRSIWAEGDRLSLSERAPEVWDTLRLLPENPPRPPFAVGFARNVGDLLDSFLHAGQIGLPGLGSALGLVRVEAVVFAAYGDVERLPEKLGRDVVRESGVSVLGVAEAGYPTFVLRFLLGRFAERGGLVEVDIDGEVAYHKEIEDGLHLLVKSFGSTMYFGVATSRGDVDEVIRSVIESQGSR